ncbi:MAG: hypothetical protein IAE91_03990 [Ignavibacteriaceae bacterium]|nr:hypothetical protein [Ignavibacteriaceae bacterium]
MRKQLIFFISILFLLISSNSLAQNISAIEVLGEYNTPLTKRLAVTSASGMGVTARVNIELFSNFYLSVNGGYQNFTVEQDSAVNQWNWVFWRDRYEGSIKADLADTASGLRASFNPFQSMNAFPVYLTFTYEFEVLDNFKVRPFAGGGVYFYTRSLYMEENWSRYYKDIDYTFAYSYKNFAPDKAGNPLFITGGLNLSYPFADYFRLNAEFQYSHFLSIEKMGFDEMPFENLLNFKLGLTFSY